jgi:hypothetical protein
MYAARFIHLQQRHSEEESGGSRVTDYERFVSLPCSMRERQIFTPLASEAEARLSGFTLTPLKAPAGLPRSSNAKPKIERRR